MIRNAQAGVAGEEGKKGAGEGIQSHIPALASLFDGATTAQSGDTGHQAALFTAATALVIRGRRLFVLHGSLALRRTVLALRRTILTLRRAVLPLGRTVALEIGDASG